MVRAGGVQGSQFGRAAITSWVTPMSDDSRSAANGSEHVAPQVDLPGRDGFTPENRAEPELDHEDANQAAEQILGANPLIGFDRAELIDAFQRLVKLLVMDPRVVLREQFNFSRELLKISTGNSNTSPSARVTLTNVSKYSVIEIIASTLFPIPMLSRNARPKRNATK